MFHFVLRQTSKHEIQQRIQPDEWDRFDLRKIIRQTLLLLASLSVLVRLEEILLFAPVGKFYGM